MGARLWENRRRVAPLVLITGALVIGLQLFDAVPRQTEIQYRLGPAHRDVSEISVTYVLEAETVAAARFRWPEGAPVSVTHEVDLLPGRYQVRADILTRGTSSTIVRALRVPADGLVRIDLFDERAVAWRIG